MENKLESTIQLFANPPHNENWRGYINNSINYMVNVYKLNPAVFRGKLYAELENATTCKLNSRLLRLRKRLEKQGVSYCERMKVNKLDTVSQDTELRLIFEGIVKKWLAYYSAQDKPLYLPQVQPKSEPVKRTPQFDWK